MSRRRGEDRDQLIVGAPAITEDRVAETPLWRIVLNPDQACLGRCVVVLKRRCGDPPDPQVHWHLLPRYRHPIEFAGTRFEDPAFGHPHDLSRSQMVSPALHRAIIRPDSASLE